MRTKLTDKLNAIHGDLRRKIMKNVWTEGERLPTTHELAKEFQCSVGMAGRAIAMLVHEGLVEQRCGVGTHVIKSATGGDSSSAQLDAFACIYPGEQHEGIWRTIKGFQDAARVAKRRVVMLTTGKDYQRETEFLSRLSEFDVRGVVIYPILLSPKDLVQFSQILTNTKFPVVLVELNLPGLGCPSVVIDGLRAGYVMTRHMIGCGAKRIGYFSNYSWAPFMRDRYEGYRWALEEAGMEEPDNGVFLDPGMTPDFDDPLGKSIALAETFLKKAGQLDAVVCADDFLALGCVAAAGRLGMKVPEDLRVSGMDDHTALAASVGVPLTTYRIPFEEMGRKAFEVLESTLNGNGGMRGEYQIRGELVIRESA